MMNIEKIEKIPIFFVVTRPRSGSTLLQSVLDAHPNICATIESRFVINLYVKYRFETNWNSTTINRFVKDVFTDRQYRLFWGTNEYELKNLFSKYDVTNFSDACKVIYLSYHSMFEKKDIRVIVDKNPSYARFIPELIKIFPDAKFIHLIRDPRAVVSSNRIAFNKKILKLAKSWVLLNGKIETTIANTVHLTVKYEDLVKTPENSFQLIFNFLKIEFNHDVLNAHSTVKKAINHHNYFSLNHHSNVSDNINTNSIDSWKNKLSEKEEIFINYITADFANKYGYELTKPPLSPIELKEINKTIKPKLFNFNLLVLFYKLPFFMRKIISKIVHLFFDKKYRK